MSAAHNSARATFSAREEPDTSGHQATGEFYDPFIHAKDTSDTQNLLLQPASETDVAAGHPLGIPLLKVADFGFARILPASAMAETLCGSPWVTFPQ